MNAFPVESAQSDTSVDSFRWKVEAEQPVSYEVRMTKGVFDPSNGALLEAGATVRAERLRRFIVIDATVHEIYGDALRRYLELNGCEYRLCVLRASEEAKTMDAVFTVAKELDAFGISRRHEPIIGIGGGILLDIAGFAASMYRRSTPYVRVPTSLIGLVDAGVGIKTGVNFGSHKNRLGTYCAPTVALLDRGFLSTVDDRHISNGLAEILKIALIKDARLFQLLEDNAELLLAERLTGRTPAGETATREVFRRAVGGMLEELEPNLWEQRLERLVDYGHSFSPTLEMRALPALLHGEAVTVDMALTTMLAEARGLVSAQDRERIIGLMRRLRLPVWHPLLEAGLLEHALRETTQHRDGRQRMPIPVGIGGACFLHDLTVTELADAAEALRRLDKSAEPGDEPLVTEVGVRAEAAGHRTIRRDGMSSTWEVITWSALPPGASLEEDAQAGTEKFCFVLAGDGELEVDGVAHAMHPGYLVSIRSGAAHRFANPGAEELSWLVVEVRGPSGSPTQDAAALAPGAVA